MTADDQHSPRLTPPPVLVWIVLALIAYASLYPFRFHPDRLVTALEGNWFGRMMHVRSGKIDTVANLLFYIPLGFLLLLRCPPAKSAISRIGRSALLGFAVSFAFEVMQHIVPKRSPSLLDVGLNTLSSAAGAGLALWFPYRRYRWSTDAWLQQKRMDSVVVFLMLTWLGLHTAPFMPQLSPRSVWNSVYLLRHWQWSLSRSALWLTLFLLFSALMRSMIRRDRFWKVFAVTLAGSIAGQVIFDHHDLEPDELIGAVCALPFIVLMGDMRTTKARQWALRLAAGSYVFSILASFNLSTSHQESYWRSFTDLFDPGVAFGPNLAKLFLSLAAKVFLYLGLLWLATESGKRLTTATIALFALTASWELLQQFHVGHAVDFSDSILILLLAAVMYLSQAVLPAGNRSEERL